MTDTQKRKNPATRGGIDRARFQYQRPHSNPIDPVISRLDQVKQTGPDTWLASCPTSRHERGDRSRGLSVREGDDGRVLIHCHAGCPVDEVVAALDLELSDLFPRREIVYPSHSPRGGLIGRPRTQRIPWSDLWEIVELDIRACSIAFTDLGNGRLFTAEEAKSIAALASRLADNISEVRHGR